MRRITKIKLRRFKTKLNDKALQTIYKTSDFIRVKILAPLKKLGKIILDLTHKVKTFIVNNQELSFLILSGIIILVIICYNNTINSPTEIIVESVPEPSHKVVILNSTPDEKGIEIECKELYNVSEDITSYINFKSNFNFKHSWAATQPIEYTLYYNEPVTKQNCEIMKEEAHILLNYIERAWAKSLNNTETIKIRIMIIEDFNSEIVIYTLENFEMRL